ncbi:YwmB family TATA-box binding protein [Paenibacillus sp. LHD-38]|uniref:YwmB family TATA-box binding protein n=1 Tax=Paenibacillus sp. LHD-38 TaxID=3072143 RepID=UPI00280FD3E1|nr:YwmB family TATA-box binding protein [Paenibacillus sp. LHD-38]MDQ8738165.1 YwmB family TATA-box binding protein [Paenibacillus sp. LHD-38]
MYIPNKTMPIRHRMSAKQRAKRTKAGILLALLVISVCAVWAMWQADRAPRETTTAEQQLQHDLQALWTWSDDELKGGSEVGDWAIRWNVTGKAGTMNGLVLQFFTEAEGKAIGKVVQNEGKTVSGMITKYGGSLSINLVQGDDQSEQLMILLDTTLSTLIEKNTLMDATADISAKLAQISPAFTSSMKVQGYTKQNQTLQHLKRLTDAKSVDRYEDAGTISETFYTRMLQMAIAVENGRSANLQAALHKETNSENTALTIGIPVITGEYSVFNGENP